VLAVQEVENIDILKRFNRDRLKGSFGHSVLIEGNDPRFIDVGVLSKLPIGAVTSFQTRVHDEDAGKRIFSRDLLEVEILNPARSKRLFTLYNTHLKSHFGDSDHGGAGKARNDDRRRKQAEAIRDVVGERQRSDARYIITGDMNDPPDSPALAPMLSIEGNALFNALADPEETRPAKAETQGPGPASKAWTHRFKHSGENPEHRLFDQIWLSPPLQSHFRRAVIDRRHKHGGDGSDHDPAWVELEL
jgi:endonuclease/exonuclease/phosphatase family metal-dependent hydrolase